MGELEKEYPTIVVNYKDCLCIRTKVPNPSGLKASSQQVTLVKPFFSRYDHEIDRMFRFCKRVTAYFIDGYICIRLIRDRDDQLLLEMCTATSGASGTPALRKLQDELDKLTRRIDDMQASTPAAPPVQSQLHARAGVPHGDRAIADNIKRLRYELIRLKESREFVNMQILNFRYPKNEEKGRRALRRLHDDLRSMDDEIRRVEDEIGDLRQQQLESPHPVGAFMGARALEQVEAEIYAIKDKISQLQRDFETQKQLEEALDTEVLNLDQDISRMETSNGNYDVSTYRETQRLRNRKHLDSTHAFNYKEIITRQIREKKKQLVDLQNELVSLTRPPA
jgi:DNA repair exonuclease SbcCD ATPase subunit